MKLVISLGGSLLTNDFSAKGVEKYVNILKDIYAETEQLVVVVGGGKMAREYIDVAKGLKIASEGMDYTGIKITHANASIVAGALFNYIKNTDAGEYIEIPNNKKELEIALKKNRLVVCGGTEPGHSTDGVAAYAAKQIKADLLINASNIGGVYDSDPRKNKKAKKIDCLSHVELLEILSENEQFPGKYGLFDHEAARIIAEIGLKTIFIDGTDPQEIYRAAFGKHNGSVVE